MGMISGKTSSGFEYEIDEKIRNNWLFIRAAAKAGKASTEEERVIALVDLVHILLGDEGENRLCEYLMDEEGVVPSDRLIGEVGEILAAMGEKEKNS